MTTDEPEPHVETEHSDCPHPHHAWEWEHDNLTHTDPEEIRVSGTCTACNQPLEWIFQSAGIIERHSGDWITE